MFNNVLRGRQLALPVVSPTAPTIQQYIIGSNSYGRVYGAFNGDTVSGRGEYTYMFEYEDSPGSWVALRNQSGQPILYPTTNFNLPIISGNKPYDFGVLAQNGTYAALVGKRVRARVGVPRSSPFLFTDYSASSNLAPPAWNPNDSVAGVNPATFVNNGLIDALAGLYLDFQITHPTAIMDAVSAGYSNVMYEIFIESTYNGVPVVSTISRMTRGNVVASTVGGQYPLFNRMDIYPAGTGNLWSVSVKMRYNIASDGVPIFSQFTYGTQNFLSTGKGGPVVEIFSATGLAHTA